jgi:hypothetical protein
MNNRTKIALAVGVIVGVIVAIVLFLKVKKEPFLSNVNGQVIVTTTSAGAQAMNNGSMMNFAQLVHTTFGDNVSVSFPATIDDTIPKPFNGRLTFIFQSELPGFPNPMEMNFAKTPAYFWNDANRLIKNNKNLKHALGVPV